MITAIELVKDKATRTPFPWQERRGMRIFEHGLANGCLIRPIGGVLYFMPPYVISEDEVRQLVRVAKEGINNAVR